MKLVDRLVLISYHLSALGKVPEPQECGLGETGSLLKSGAAPATVSEKLFHYVTVHSLSAWEGEIDVKDSQARRPASPEKHSPAAGGFICV